LRILFLFLLSTSFAQASSWWEDNQIEYDFGDVISCSDGSFGALEIVEGEHIFKQDLGHDSVTSLDSALVIFQDRAPVFASKLDASILKKIQFTTATISQMEHYRFLLGAFGWGTVHPYTWADHLICETFQLYKVVVDPLSSEITKVLVSKQLWDQLSERDRISARIQLMFFAGQGPDTFAYVVPKLKYEFHLFYLLRQFLNMATANKIDGVAKRAWEDFNKKLSEEIP
jgi:hypothetical protein